MKEVEKYYYDNVFESLSVNLLQLVTDSARMCTKTYVKIRLILRMPCNIILFSCSSLYVIPLKILRKLKEEKRNSFSIWLVFDKKLQGYNTCICLEVDLSSPCFECLEDSYIQELKSPAVSPSAHSRQNYY